MPSGSIITSITARQVYSSRGHPGVEATVKTANGATGVAICTAGVSVGTHEVAFAYDGGTKWRGKGVQRAVDSVNNNIAPELIGMDASQQLAVDDAMLNIGGPKAKQRLGGNATAAVSAAVLKAGAASLGIPLYQHIGGVNAFVLPVPGVICLVGSDRYGSGTRSGGKPSHALMAYDFETFSEASYAAWDVGIEWEDVLHKKFGIPKSSVSHHPTVPAGIVKHDFELWDLMVETIIKCGYEGKIGIQVDVASETYWEEDIGKYVGLFSDEPKTKDDLFEFYRVMTTEYPFVIIEDPFDEDDYEAHAILTQELDIQIVGDDLFTTDPLRVQKGIDAGAANTRAAQGQPDRHHQRGLRHGAPGLPQRLRRDAVQQSRRGRGHCRLLRGPELRHHPRERHRPQRQPSAPDRGRTGQPRRGSSARKASKGDVSRIKQEAGCRMQDRRILQSCFLHLVSFREGEMNHRERALAALNHQEPDRVPLDLGSTRNTGILEAPYRALVEYLGLDDVVADAQTGFGMTKVLGLAKPDEAVLQRLGTDFRGFYLGKPDVTREKMLPDGRHQDALGVIRHQPPGSHYFDVVHSPFDREITISDIVNWPWPDPTDPGITRGLREKALHIRETTDCALILHLQNIIVHDSQYMRGFERWYMDLALAPDLIGALMDAILDVTDGENTPRAGGSRRPHRRGQLLRRHRRPTRADYVAPDVPADHQTAPQALLRPAPVGYGCQSTLPLVRRSQHVDPRLPRYGHRLHQPGAGERGGDGYREVEAGIRRPDSVSGARWTRCTCCPLGTPEDVRAEVRQRIRDLAPGGGYVLTAVHNIQPDVPPENIVAMYDAARELGQYPIDCANTRSDFDHGDTDAHGV